MRIRKIDYIEVPTEHFAKAIDKARDKANLTIEQVCDLAGVSKQYWHNLHDSSRDGFQSFEWLKVAAVIKVLDCTPADLGLFFQPEPQAPASAPTDEPVVGYKFLKQQQDWYCLGILIKIENDEQYPDGWYRERDLSSIPEHIYTEAGLGNYAELVEEGYYMVDAPDGWLPLPTVLTEAE